MWFLLLNQKKLTNIYFLAILNLNKLIRNIMKDYIKLEKLGQEIK